MSESFLHTVFSVIWGHPDLVLLMLSLCTWVYSSASVHSELHSAPGCVWMSAAWPLSSNERKCMTHISAIVYCRPGSRQDCFLLCGDYIYSHLKCTQHIPSLSHIISIECGFYVESWMTQVLNWGNLGLFGTCLQILNMFFVLEVVWSHSEN